MAGSLDGACLSFECWCALFVRVHDGSPAIVSWLPVLRSISKSLVQCNQGLPALLGFLVTCVIAGLPSA